VCIFTVIEQETLLYVNYICNSNFQEFLVITLSNMPAGIYIVFKYTPFTFTLLLPQKGTRYN